MIFIVKPTNVRYVCYALLCDIVCKVVIAQTTQL